MRRRRRALQAIGPLLVLCAAVVVASVERPHNRWTSARHPQLVWTAPGAAPLADAVAAALVTPRPEQHPGNATANDFAPTDAQLRTFRRARDAAGETNIRWNPLFRYVTGRSRLTDPSTDDLIQWTAHKWGIPEDLVRAQVTLESDQRMSQMGDRRTLSPQLYARYPGQARIGGTSDVYESMGITQVKWVPDGSVGAGTEPLRWKSTAFDLDVYGATVRYYYDGYCRWCMPRYGRGQRWNSIGAWYSPSPWGNVGAVRYANRLRGVLMRRPWK